MEEARLKVAAREDINPKYLSFLEKQEERDIVIADLWYFNIEDPNHRKYKSTVVYMERIEK